jgi:predicted RNase H-like HicB family nuclease
MSSEVKKMKIDLLKEKDGSYGIACSALGVYSVGRTLKEAKTNFKKALKLHLEVLKETASIRLEKIEA